MHEVTTLKNTILTFLSFTHSTKTLYMRPLFLCLLIVLEIPSWGQMEVGAWREHLPYSETIDVAYGDGIVYCATPFSVFSFNTSDNSIERISKVNLLSGSDVSAIHYDETSSTLIVAYESGNIDLVTKGTSFQLSDISQSNVFGSKRVNEILVKDGKAYLSCGFGIVVVNIARREIADTWFLNGQNDIVEVNALDSDETYWYAATEIGVFRAERSNPILANFQSWEIMSDVPMEDANYTDIMVLNDQLFLVHETSEGSELWYANRTDFNWAILPGYESTLVHDINFGNGQFAVCSKDLLTIFNDDLSIVSTHGSIASVNIDPKAVLFDEANNVWFANFQKGLFLRPAEGFEMNYQPEGPNFFNARRIDSYNNNTWIASGGVDGTWTNNYDKKGIYGIVDDEWVNVAPGEGENDIASINDFMAVSINPLANNTVFLGSWEEGLIQMIDGEIVEIYNQDNSTLLQANFSGSERIGVGGVDYDQEGNLWFTNAYTANPLQVRQKNGEFVSFNFQPDITSNEFLGDVVAARQGFIWSILPRGNGLLVLDHQGTIGNPNDDNYRVLTNEEGEGGLPSMDIYALEEDLDGEMWVGTLQGIAVFFAPDGIFTSDNFDAQQILIEQDGNIQILLETEQINCIEIDGANRKWVGTANSGVYLLSDDGLNQIYHFTTSNSPLLSNNIFDISIDHSAGEVFFATERGVVSFNSTATNFVDEIEEVTVYPNPVREDYEGIITVDGLAYQTDVKITDVSGNLVFATESNGGRATWDGKGMDGKRVSTGVYLIFCTNQDGSTSNVAKVAVVR